MEDERHLLVCAPAGDEKAYIKGSVTAECELCLGRVWVAPSGQRIMEGMMVVCIPCGLATIEQSDEPVDHRIAPGGIDELIEAIHKSITDTHPN